MANSGANAWLFLLAFLVLLPYAPYLHPIPNRDSGLFLYAGWRMLHGEVPYRDVWDHKPPLIFFIDALGLALGGGSCWGVWVLEIVSLGGALALCRRLLAPIIGPVPALASCTLWGASVFLLLHGGNMTEEYALPLQFTVLLLFAKSEEHKHYGWRAFTIGALVGLILLLKQNVIGVGIAVAIYILVARSLERRWKELLATAGLGLLGAAVPIAAAGLYFGLSHALDDLWEQAFAFNAAYARAGGDSRLVSLTAGLQMLSGTGIVAITFAGWFAAAILVSTRSPLAASPIIRLAIPLLPIEFFLSSLSGQTYAHYYLAWLPVFSILTGFLAFLIQELLRRDATRRAKRPGRIAIAWALAFAALLALRLPAVYWMDRMRMDFKYLEKPSAEEWAVGFIREKTVPGEQVFIWGAEAGILFTAGRTSPTSLVYQYPLFTRGYDPTPLAEQLLADLKARPPDLIIDTAMQNERIPPIDPVLRKGWIKQHGPDGLHPKVAEAVDYIDAHYTYLGILRGSRWVTYARRAGARP